MKGTGSSSYIDSVILRDRDANSSGWLGSSDGTLEQRHYYCENWRADVVVLALSGGTPAEFVRYSSYGEPTVYAFADLNRDGVLNGDDYDDYYDALGETYSGLAVPLDLNGDGNIDPTDVGDYDTSESLNSNYTSRGNVGTAYSENRKGYAGYEWDTNERVYHVRHRVYLPENGRWTRRDPLGYHDGMSLYEYVAGMTVKNVDPKGLCKSTGSCNSTITMSAIALARYSLLEETDIERCNRCVNEAKEEPGTSAMIAEMLSRGCPVLFTGCRPCNGRNGLNDPPLPVKGFTDPETGAITICADRISSCDYAKTMFKHELLHAYDLCQRMDDVSSDNCCACMRAELRAYRFDGGCSDDGVRRSIPGPNGKIPNSESDCLKSWASMSCRNQCDNQQAAACFDSVSKKSRCFPFSVVPKPNPPPRVVVPINHY